MKRKAFIALTLLALSSCSTKPCHCYLLERWGSVRESETYTKANGDCSALGYTNPNPDDSSMRICTETDADTLDYRTVIQLLWGQ